LRFQKSGSAAEKAVHSTYRSRSPIGGRRLCRLADGLVHRLFQNDVVSGKLAAGAAVERADVVPAPDALRSAGSLRGEDRRSERQHAWWRTSTGGKRTPRCPPAAHWYANPTTHVPVTTQPWVLPVHIGC
jgi:hypothetical protein